MISKLCDSDVVRIVMELRDGQKLQRILEGLAEVCGSDEIVDRYETIAERVGDANSVAMWLREYVHLDLSRKDALFLLESLEEHPDELSTITKRVSEVLELVHL